ncbi:unnamed protein product [Effrenium voratum]|nr:unnamed protein product [Effrenium voratum]
MNGRILSQWWDSSSEAGPASRPESQFSVPLPSLEVVSKYASTHSSALADMEESFGKNTALATALKFKEGARPTTQVSAGSGPTPPRPARTSASPDWGDAHPPNTARVGTFSHVTLNDFETNNTVANSCTIARCTSLTVALTTSGDLWILNKSTAEQTLTAGELFGFNFGAFADMPSGTVGQSQDHIPWLIVDDMQLADTDGTSRPMSFRYTVKPRMKVNAFKPKELTAEEKGAGELRASQFGALWCNKFASIPKNKDCGIIWEARGWVALSIC